MPKDEHGFESDPSKIAACRERIATDSIANANDGVAPKKVETFDQRLDRFAEAILARLKEGTEKQILQLQRRVDDLEVQTAKHDERSRGAAKVTDALAERVLFHFLQIERPDVAAKSTWEFVRAFEAARDGKMQEASGADKSAK